jgi:hypothetical protein
VGVRGWLIFAVVANAVFAASREEWLFQHPLDDASRGLAAWAAASCFDCGEENPVNYGANAFEN